MIAVMIDMEMLLMTMRVRSRMMTMMMTTVMMMLVLVLMMLLMLVMLPVTLLARLMLAMLIQQCVLLAHAQRARRCASGASAIDTHEHCLHPVARGKLTKFKFSCPAQFGNGFQL